MQTFLEETLKTIQQEHKDLSSLTLIFPSKRAGGFARNYLRKTAVKSYFAPRILSIEEFIEELSDLKIIDTTQLLFKSYQVYLSTNSVKEKENFEIYSSWATTLLADLNEIDRHLIDPEPFFNYLSNIQDINHWYVKDEKTELIENYLNFWNSLHEFYNGLKEALLQEKMGYQGMVYRKAAEDVEHYCHNKGNEPHVFIGFNALNNSEQHLIQELLETGNTQVFWDTDSYFYSDDKHSASLFLRKYTKEWKYFKTNSPRIIGNHFQEEKKFKLVEVQKNIAQAKHVGEILSKLSETALNNTAIILADENLLVPILHSLPKNVASVNITMGVSLMSFPMAHFFESLLSLHIHSRPNLYYKEVLGVLNHPLATSILPNAPNIINTINSRNISHLSLEVLNDLSEGSNHQMLKDLFGDWKNDSKTALRICLQLVKQLKNELAGNSIEITILHQLYLVFTKINSVNDIYPYLKGVKSTQRLFSDLVSTSTLDFKGDAYNGLQIMGILETRVLDFENIIVTSVNEGVLPAGKSNASFITYDLKRQFGLPHYTEKDAIYTYHFYHLLHRAKDITLLYNNQSDGLNAGEKSRFILQLEVDKLPNHSIDKMILAPIVEIEQRKLKTINKTEDVLIRLKEIAEKGFSPSALTSYIRNPIDFYLQKILRISEFDEVEETVAANTLGTIVHDTLEAFYKPLEGLFLNSELLLKMKQNIAEEVTKQFHKTFKAGSFDKGRNLLIFEVAKRYVSNFISFELSELKKGNTIKIIQIETNLAVEVPISEIDFPVMIGGKVDRVDEFNGDFRIIDYKTGRVEQPNLEIVDWKEITTDHKYSKAFQVLAYALMIREKNPFQQAEAGIISFKNLNNGFLKFATKEKPGSRTKQTGVTQETLDLYTTELKKLILEICDMNIAFTEKEIE